MRNLSACQCCICCVWHFIVINRLGACVSQSELRQQIEQQYTAELPFIVWYSTAAAEAKIELVDYFLRQVIDTVTVDRFQLLDMEQMWSKLLRLNEIKDCGSFSRHWRKTVEVIDWQMKKDDGSTALRSCCFRCEGLLALYEELLER